MERHLRGAAGCSRLACGVRLVRAAEKKKAVPAPARLPEAAVCALHAGGLCRAYSHAGSLSRLEGRLGHCQEEDGFTARLWGADSRGLGGGWGRKSPLLERVGPGALAWCPAQSPAS